MAPTSGTLTEILGRPRVAARILLVVPSQESVYGTRMRPAYPSLGILWVAAVLEKAGHTVAVVDMDADGMDAGDVAEAAARGEYAFVGFTSVTATYPAARTVARTIRRRCPNTRIVLGGIHATVDAQACAGDGAFDYVVVGEGELTMVELVDALLTNGNIAEVAGLAFAQGDAVRTTAPRALLDNLDELPMPARHLCRHPRRYAPADAAYAPAVPVMASRGCPGRCTFCGTSNIFGRSPRYRSPHHVVSEFRELVNRYGVREIHFFDDALTANRRFVLELCALLAREPYRLRLEVANGLRADMVDEELLTALRSVGLKNVGFGVESGSERVLRDIRKGITKDQVRKAVALAKRLGLKTWCFFIIGLPTDTEATIRETIDFSLELDPTFAKFLALKPFPGSEACASLERSGLILSKDYSRYGVYTAPVHELPGISAQRLGQLQRMAFRKFYLRPSKVAQHLTGITSLHRLTIIARGGWFVLTRMVGKG